MVRRDGRRVHVRGGAGTAPRAAKPQSSAGRRDGTRRETPRGARAAPRGRSRHLVRVPVKSSLVRSIDRPRALPVASAADVGIVGEA